MKVLGVDVGSQTLACRCSGESKGRSFRNNPSGQLGLLKWGKKQSVDLVVLEATGGYERSLCKVLWAAGVRVAVVNPRRIRQFAYAEGKRAKSDSMDAEILVLFGERMQPTPTEPLPKDVEQLRTLLTRREQLVDMMVQEKNHEKAPGMTPEVRKSIRTLRATLQRQIQSINCAIHTIIDQSEVMKPRAEALRAQTGVGAVLLATLLADMPELGTIRRNTASALIGVAPYNQDSGTHTGLRRISGGRARPRRALYMATLNAIRNDPYLKEFYKRLLARGKPRKVAVVACMRKFVTHLNSVLKTQMVASQA